MWPKLKAKRDPLDFSLWRAGATPAQIALHHRDQADQAEAAAAYHRARAAPAEPTPASVEQCAAFGLPPLPPYIARRSPDGDANTPQYLDHVQRSIAKGMQPTPSPSNTYKLDTQRYTKEGMQLNPAPAAHDHVSPTGGLRERAGKIPVELAPPSLTWAVAAVLGKAAGVLGKGAAKYAPRNWEKGMEYSVCYACAVRHLLKWWGGEERDPESGETHLAHVATNVAFLIEYDRRMEAGTLPASLDDRPFHFEVTP